MIPRPIRISLGFLLFVFFALPLGKTHAWTNEDRDQFRKANQSYQTGKFQEAVSTYRGLSEKYPKTAVLFYDLGNSYYRAGSLGPAILAYERALLWNPRDADTRFNLNYVRGLLEYRIEEKRNWYLRAAEAALNFVTFEEATLLALSAYALFIGVWVFTLFFRRGLAWGWVRKTLLSLTVLFFALWGIKQFESRMLRDAVVLAKQAGGRYGPTEGDQVAFRLGEGLKVYVMDHRADWSRVMLTNGESGWMKNDQIAEVLV